MSQDESAPKLHVDTDWKAEAQAEKERLIEKEKERDKARDASGSAGRPGELPDADFRSLVGILASQAIMGLGAMADQKSGRVVVDLPGAKFNIDLLEVLLEKTKGNLTDEESSELEQVLRELRERFVQIAQAVAQQMSAPPDAGGPQIGSPVSPPVT